MPIHTNIYAYMFLVGFTGILIVWNSISSCDVPTVVIKVQVLSVNTFILSVHLVASLKLIPIAYRIFRCTSHIFFFVKF